MNIYETIKKSYIRLSKGQRKVAQFILDQPQTIVNNIANEVGRLAGVSESTVIRFCYALELDGYHELQTKLAEYLTVEDATSRPKVEKATSNNSVKTSMLNDIKIISKMLEKIDSKQINRIVDFINGAKYVKVVGFRENEMYANALSYHLSAVHPNTKLINFTDLAIAQSISEFSTNHVLLFFAEAGRLEDLDYIIQHALDKGVKIIVISPSKIKGYYATKADVNIVLDKQYINDTAMYSFICSISESVAHVMEKNVLYT